MSGCQVPLCTEEAVETMAILNRPPTLIRMCERHAEEFTTPVDLAPPRPPASRKETP